jgi:hypothetical protein
MSKLITTAVLTVFWTVAAGAGDAIPTIDLNRPGALEALQHSNPTHYKKVRKIIDGLLEKPDAAVPRWIENNFDARNVNYGPVLLTTDPAKKRLSFALDDTRYEAVVTLTNVRGEIVPLK